VTLHIERRQVHADIGWWAMLLHTFAGPGLVAFVLDAVDCPIDSDIVVKWVLGPDGIAHGASPSADTGGNTGHPGPAP
jgi:hypothetical protein